MTTMSEDVAAAMAELAPDIPWPPAPRAKSSYLTLVEIAMLYRRPESTLRRLASTDHWERTEDGRKPVLYLATDVAKTMLRLAKRRKDKQT